ncbi:uncharacterized protein LOC121260026 isoform X1 [Juglans microcarpa x Juglans regia]|uniref:uncharacterized protein LOC121260026 isoform X1 n=1 Tax=Juglans microcarpa x Juglans regia TaxID=2249226 RepID=UPI001B7DFB74|nr:uncharacterized protein LOC121260026 isoform X1 [Juglans microcarpa x Juglans regia]
MPVRKTDFFKSRKYFPNQLELPQQHPDEQEKNTSYVSASASTPIASLITVLPGRPPVSIFLKEPGNCCPAAESNHLRFTSEHGIPHSADSRGNTDNERKEQLLYIQKLLNLHEEYDKRDNIQMFCHLSSVELSRYAVNLEKRSIQLSIEEVKEIRRMNALNIFGKSSPTSHPSPTFQQVQTKR